MPKICVFRIRFSFVLVICGCSPAFAAQPGLGNDFFSPDYASAKNRFLRASEVVAAHGARAQVFSFRLPGPDPTLTINATYLKPKESQRLVIISSGVHGAEGLAGSALQTYFLSKIYSTLNSQRLGVLLIHAVNPSGFANERRVTEQNVDLNRNFLPSVEDFKHVRNSGYNQFRSTLNLAAPVEGVWWRSLVIASNFIWPALRGGSVKREATEAVVSGQYVDPQGLFFGGEGYAPQVEWLDKVINRVSAGYREVVHVDLHTGYGQAKTLQLILSEKTDPAQPFVQTLFLPLRSNVGVKIVRPTAYGFYQTSGDITDYVYARVARHKIKVASFTAEFGTLGDGVVAQLTSLSRMVLENQGFHHGFASLAVEQEVKRNFRELFNPFDSGWRDQVLLLGADALRAVCAISTDRR